ncbi:Glutathione peroxidase 1 [Holothuria leucospilota]|uniref:Glutathione peroxidase 1 n=1 Tax=Holothuria leucospilota TaxID=206669 RepID=A0A9Q1CGA4_HOLLE|nr:Glutathione peroxidase 1 [Holothuria leucospilota]
MLFESTEVQSALQPGTPWVSWMRGKPAKRLSKVIVDLEVKLLVENSTNDEILNMLKYVRPGNGFQPLFPIFQKVEVNGINTHPVFDFLKASLPAPSDDPFHLMDDPKKVIWYPVQRHDIRWNFEKFLIRPDGIPFKRYSPSFESRFISPDIEQLLEC